MLVSHDRYLINRLATQIWELRDSTLQVFKGSYREFVLRRTASSAATPARQVLLPPKPLARDNSKETRRREQSLALLEERIREQEHAVQCLSSELQRAGAAQSFDRLRQLSSQIAQAQATLESLLAEWEKVAV